MQIYIIPRHTAVSGGYQGMAECPATVIAKTITFVCSEMPKVLMETLVLPYTNQTQYQKLMSQNLNFWKDYFVCTFPKHFASIDISNKSLKHAFAPHFASNSCSCWAPCAFFYVLIFIFETCELKCSPSLRCQTSSSSPCLLHMESHWVARVRGWLQGVSKKRGI